VLAGWGDGLYLGRMINRGDILLLGIASAVWGCLIGGSMLGLGLSLIVGGQPLGWILLLPASIVAAIPGWLLARKLARRL
jgi:integral membrane sensor domain MASE1